MNQNKSNNHGDVNVCAGYVAKIHYRAGITPVIIFLVVTAFAVLGVVGYSVFKQDVNSPKLNSNFKFIDTKPTSEKPTSNLKSCVVGGCSGQICSDVSEGGMGSTCEWRDEYACYKKAKCERQLSGQCGWTETPELKSCLSNPPK